jgi:hypothetical protein
LSTFERQHAERLADFQLAAQLLGGVHQRRVEVGAQPGSGSWAIDSLETSVNPL